MSRFSQLYLERGQPTRDSTRLRKRLASYVSAKANGAQFTALRERLETECGIDVSRHGTVVDVFTGGELRDFLDAITIYWDVLTARRLVYDASDWLRFVERALSEENVGYQVDKKCVVHYHVDHVFEQSRAATLKGLEATFFGSARAAFDDAYRHLDSGDTKASARAIFEAVESVAKLIVPDGSRLTRNLCTQKLKEACLAVATQEPIERAALSELFSSLGYWVDAVHNYRHGQASADPVAPSEETAVLILAEGTVFLRQLAYYASRAAGLV